MGLNGHIQPLMSVYPPHPQKKNSPVMNSGGVINMHNQATLDISRCSQLYYPEMTMTDCAAFMNLFIFLIRYSDLSDDQGDR